MGSKGEKQNYLVVVDPVTTCKGVVLPPRPGHGK